MRKEKSQQDAWTHTLKSRASHDFPRMVRHDVRIEKMKTRLKCPRCGTPYPVGRLVRQFGWRMRCPSCGVGLVFSQRSAQRLGAIAGLTFGVLIVLVGPQCIMTWPTFAFFMLFAFVYARILSLFVGSLDLAPEKRSFDLFPNQRGVFKVLSIIGVSGMTIGGLAGFFSKHFPLWGHAVHFGIILVSLVCALIGMGNGAFGKHGWLKKADRDWLLVGDGGDHPRGLGVVHPDQE